MDLIEHPLRHLSARGIVEEDEAIASIEGRKLRTDERYGKCGHRTAVPRMRAYRHPDDRQEWREGQDHVRGVRLRRPLGPVPQRALSELSRVARSSSHGTASLRSLVSGEAAPEARCHGDDDDEHDSPTVEVV